MMIKGFTGHESRIEGLHVIDLEIRHGVGGWEKESYHAEKLYQLGLPKMDAVQHNLSFNSEIGVTRGLHAEPWEKFVSLAAGRILGAWVDLRAGPGFGRVMTLELTPAKAVFIPRGVANGYQTLENDVLYSYLVNAHWSPSSQYTCVNLFDPSLAIPWPVPMGEAIVSEKDARMPMLRDIKPLVL